MNDQDIAAGFLAYLARKFDRPSLAYAEGPTRISGGYDASIFGFALKDPPPSLDGPLILRLNRPVVDALRIKVETTVHNWLAGQGYIIPAVRLSETDASILGGRLTVMTRIAGRPLAHEVERILGGASMAAKVGGLLRLPTMLGEITEAWVDAQVRLHALDPAPLLAAFSAAGLDPAILTLEGQLARWSAGARQFAPEALTPVVDWLHANRPPTTLRAAVCHGDFHPLNILADNGKVTGVIDWVNVVVAPAEMDVGSAIANIGTVPFDVPTALALPLRLIIARILRNYRRAYAARRPLDARAVGYFEVFRCLAQLVAVLQSRATGVRGGAFDSAAGMARLARRIHAISGVAVRI